MAFLSWSDGIIGIDSPTPNPFLPAGWPTPEGCKITILPHAHENGIAALDALAEALNAPATPANLAALKG